MVAMAPLTWVMLVSITVGVTAALMAWRERPEPGAVPLTVMLIGGSIWSALFVFELQAPTVSEKLFWSNLQWIGVVLVPVGWLCFALEYSGHDRYVTVRSIGALAIIPAITVGLALTEGRHQLLYVDFSVVRAGGLTLLHRVGGPWYWVITAYTYVLGALGAIPLLELVWNDAKPFRGQSAAILIGILAPGGINALFLVGAVPVKGFDPTPIGFAISGVAYLGALRRFRLFGRSPAPAQGAHRFTFERMHEGAIVVDSHDYIVDANENVSQVLGIEFPEALGRAAADVIPNYEALPAEGQADEYLTIDRDGPPGFYDVNVTQITDYHDRTVGKIITFHNIEQHLRQQQRLEVFNRVLRHNIRTETNLIFGNLEEAEFDDEPAIERAKSHAERIENLSEQARTIADIFAREDDESTALPLEGIIDDSVSSVLEDHPAIDIQRKRDAESIQVSSVLQPVIRNVIENAAEHNSKENPRIRIECYRNGGIVEIVVEDNGPGIDEYEREVLERGRETQLQHGSGLGLWLITWGANIAGGEVTFESNEPNGSVITISAPVLQIADSTDPDPVLH